LSASDKDRVFGHKRARHKAQGKREGERRKEEGERRKEQREILHFEAGNSSILLTTMSGSLTTFKSDRVEKNTFSFLLPPSSFK